MENLTFTHVGILTGAVVLVLSFVLLVKAVIRRDPPLHKEFVDRESYERDRGEIREELRRNAVARKTNYEKLEAQGREITALRTETENQSKQLSTLDGKMDQVLMRLPRK